MSPRVLYGLTGGQRYAIFKRMTQTNLTTKATLARLMSAENLTVDINSSAPTASFNLVDRTLTLPVWDIGDEAYNMLVGHEVSHALYTPAGEALAKGCDAIDPKNTAVARDYINVVEDARIERMIKNDYPGLRRSFAEGYREFIKRDLFKVSGQDISKFGLIDRINLHYKIGWTTSVPFSPEEFPLVRRVAETKTWDEVVALSKELYDFAKQQKKQEQENENAKSDKGAETPEEQDGEQEQGENEQGGDQSSEGEMSEDKQEQGQGKPQAQSSESGEDDGQDSGDEQEANQAAQADEDAPPSGAKTMTAMAEGLKELAAKSECTPIETVNLPTELPENFVVPMGELMERLERSIRQDQANQFYSVWKSENSGDIQALWSEFERRKAADAHRRAVSSDTGVLDPLRLVHYKVSDDIFLTNTTVRDGKNHGIVLFVDMSGSMNERIFGTMVQTLNLAAFARRANIPFVVYGFGDKFRGFGAMGSWGKGWEYLTETMSMISGDRARLVTLIQSGQTQAEFQKSAGYLLGMAAGLSHSNMVPKSYCKAYASVTNGYYPNALRTHLLSNGIDMGGTPTNHALLAATVLVPQFKAKHRLQVVNTVVMTDGGASDNIMSGAPSLRENGVARATIVRDPLTRREYKMFEMSRRNGYTAVATMMAGEQQQVFATILRERMGGHVIAIGLAESSHGMRTMLSNLGKYYLLRDDKSDDALRKHFNDKDYIKVSEKNSKGYDTTFVIKVTGGSEEAENWMNTNASVDDKKSLNRLNRAFIKSLESKRTNRPLMGQIAEVIASNLS